MKTKPLPALLSLLIAGILPAAATPLNPDQVPGKASWYLHADLDNLRDTSVGTLLMESVEEKHGKQLRAVKRMFSINPFTDLHGLTLWGPGEKDQAALVVKGSFDREHLTDLISAAKDHETSDHHGQTVHAWADEKKEDKMQYGAFHGDDLIVFSEQRRLVLQTLDVLDGRSDALESASGGESASFLLGVANLEDIDIRGDDAHIFSKVRSLQARFHEEEERLHCEIKMTTTSNEEAKRFAKVLEGIVALGELTNENIANLDLASNIAVKDDTTVHASMSIPSEHLLEAMKEAGALGEL